MKNYPAFRVKEVTIGNIDFKIKPKYEDILVSREFWYADDLPQAGVIAHFDIN